MSDAETNLSCTPQLREIADNAVINLLPKKSKAVYEKCYHQFELWAVQNNVNTISENILLAYFELQGKNKKSSTLWSMYSMLRSCFSIYKNTDISKYIKLQAYLKRFSEGYEAKNSKILCIEDINKFIEEGSDALYLVIKIVLIMGYTGACRRDELTNMSIHDLEFKSDIILVTVPKTKNNIVRVFAITDEKWITLIKKYVALRPKNINHSRFFLTYRNGYCMSCPIGINTIGKMPKLIADFLKLPNSELYTGHCFRRSSATHLADAGSDLLTIKRHGGWKSSAVAEGYIETSMKSKVAVAHNLSGPSTSGHSRVISSNDSQSQESTSRANNITRQNFVTKNLPGITIHAQDTCSVSVNVYNNSTFHNNNNVN